MAPQITSIMVVPTAPSLNVGATVQLSAIAIYNDGTSADVTGQAAWASSNPAAVTIAATGLAQAVAAGSSLISAAYSGSSGGTSLTVNGTTGSTMNPCEALVQAKQQLYLLSAGQALVAVETPQLGRVEYSKGDIGALQRYIDGLAAQCAALMGMPCSGRRRPISIEAWP